MRTSLGVGGGCCALGTPSAASAAARVLARVLVAGPDVAVVLGCVSPLPCPMLWLRGASARLRASSCLLRRLFFRFLAFLASEAPFFVGGGGALSLVVVGGAPCVLVLGILSLFVAAEGVRVVFPPHVPVSSPVSPSR